MAKNKNEPGAADQETDEILKEMEDEGIPTTEDEDDDEDAEAKSKKKEDEKDKDSDDEDEEEEDDEDSEDEDDDEEVDEDEDEEDSDDDEDSDDEDDDAEDDDDGEDDDEEDDQPRGRNKRFIPLWQHKKELKQQEKRLRKDLSKAAKDASETADDVDEDSGDVLDIVKKYGLPNDKGQGQEFVSAIIKAAAKRVNKNVSADDIAKIKQTVADQEEDRLFNREMAKTEKTLRKLFPEAKGKDIARIKERLKVLAYTEKYEKYSLRDILMLNRDKLEPKAKKKTGESTGERGSAKVKVTKRYNLDDPDSIPWGDLTDEEFDEVSTALEKRSGSGLKIIRRGKGRK